MNFLQTIIDIFLYGSPTISLTLFVVSLALIIIGVAVKIWKDAGKLINFDDVPLSRIESTHPHIPSLKILTIFNLSTLAFLALALENKGNIFPLDPDKGIKIVTLFVLVAVVGTFAVLRWKQAQRYVFEFVFGSVLAFSIFGVFFTEKPLTLLQQLLLSILTLYVVIAAILSREKGLDRLKGLVVSIIVFVFWISVLVTYFQ